MKRERRKAAAARVVPRNQAEEWPDLKPLDEPAADAFPVEVFPESLRAYALELAAVVQAPVDLAAGVMLAAASAAIGQSVQLELRASWTEPALLYLALVAPPASKKSTILRLGLKPLYDLDASLQRDWRQARATWFAERTFSQRYNSAREPDPAPLRRRLVVRDVNARAALAFSRMPQRGLLHELDDGGPWLNALNGARSDRAFWIANYDGARTSLDMQAGQSAGSLEKGFVAVVAGISPRALSGLRPAASAISGDPDRGLDRVLFVMPGAANWPTRQWHDGTVSEQAEAAWREVIGRLFRQPMVKAPEPGLKRLAPARVVLTTEGAAAWRDWYNAVGALMDANDCPAERRAELGSTIQASARLALVASRLRLAADPSADLQGPVEAADVRAGAALARYFDRMRACVAALRNQEQAKSAGVRLIKWLQRSRRTQFTPREASNDLRRGMSDAERDAGIQELSTLGLIRAFDPRPNQSGRKPNAAYQVHPHIADLALDRIPGWLIRPDLPAPKIEQNTTARLNSLARI